MLQIKCDFYRQTHSLLGTAEDLSVPLRDLTTAAISEPGLQAVNGLPTATKVAGTGPWKKAGRVPWPSVATVANVVEILRTGQRRWERNAGLIDRVFFGLCWKRWEVKVSGCDDDIKYWCRIKYLPCWHWGESWWGQLSKTPWSSQSESWLCCCQAGTWIGKRNSKCIKDTSSFYMNVWRVGCGLDLLGSRGYSGDGMRLSVGVCVWCWCEQDTDLTT